MISVQPLEMPPFLADLVASQWACGESAFPSAEDRWLAAMVVAAAVVWSSQASPMALFLPIGAARGPHLECVVLKVGSQTGGDWD
jgi:hypothetical protein